jgi:hypothetical protein
MNAFAAAMAANGIPVQPQIGGGMPTIGGGSSALDSIETGTRQVGARVVVSGVEKAGKTTLACGAPRALLIPMEMGFGSMSIAKTRQLEAYDDIKATLIDIRSRAQRGQFEFKSIVLDSATAGERSIHAKTLEGDKDWRPGNPKGLTMESALGGYGKAYGHANELFGDLLSICDELAFYGGINIIWTAHTFASKMIDPAFGEFDSWDLLLHSPKNNKNYGKREMLTQWADMIAFVHEPFFITKGDQIQQATTMNQGRVAGVERKPAYVAGNRFGITGTIGIPTIPSEVPSHIKAGHCWNSIANAVHVATGGQIDLFNRDI